MTMRLIKIVLFASLLLYKGMVNADTVYDADEVQQSQAATQSANSPQKSDAQTQIEQAADHFDAFALQMPNVITAKLDAFRKHGFRAILLDDPETKPGEEAMIDSLVKGLQAMGNSLSEELSRPKPSPASKVELPAKKQVTNQ